MGIFCFVFQNIVTNFFHILINFFLNIDGWEDTLVSCVCAVVERIVCGMKLERRLYLRETMLLSGWYNHTKGSHDMVATHKVACYACYHYYIWVVSNWSHGAGHVRLPTCVEHNIECQFPGNGVHVGFIASSNSNKGDKW